MKEYTEPIKYLRAHLPGKSFQDLIELYGGRSLEIPADTTEEEDAEEIRKTVNSLLFYRDLMSYDTIITHVAAEYGYPEEEIRALCDP